MKKIAVIFAGGTGQRMKANIPKQFLKVHSKEIIIHTIELFENNSNVDEIYIACIEDWIPYLEGLIDKFNIKKVMKVIPGGKTGQDTIFNGLVAVKKDNNDAIVLIHDGVRPLVSDETITKCIKSVEETGTAITITPSYETPIITKNGKVYAMPKREEVSTAQAPQCFYLNDILNAHINERINNPGYDGIIDSCTLMFKNGVDCTLVEGNRGNIKVTTPEDYCVLIGNYNTRDYSEYMKLVEEDNKKSKVKKLEEK